VLGEASGRSVLERHPRVHPVIHLVEEIATHDPELDMRRRRPANSIDSRHVHLGGAEFVESPANVVAQPLAHPEEWMRAVVAARASNSAQALRPRATSRPPSESRSVYCNVPSRTAQTPER